MAYIKLNCSEPDLSIEDIFRLVYFQKDATAVGAGIIKGLKVILV